VVAELSTEQAQLLPLESVPVPPVPMPKLLRVMSLWLPEI
jgi:hypothetical protein